MRGEAPSAVAEAAASSVPPSLTPRQLTLATILVGTGAVLSSGSGSAVTITYPVLTTVFDAAPATISWISLAYNLVAASTLTIFGRLADLRGRKRLYGLGLGTFLAGTVLCALSRDVTTLILWRILQGIGGALISANSVAYLVEVYPANRRGFVVGVWEAGIAIGFAAGPVVGGLLLAAYGWPAVFLASLPIVGAMLLMLPRFMVEPPRQRPHQTFDFAGAALFGVGVAALLYAVTESYRLGWTSPPVAGSLLAAAACTALFIVVERRIAQPMVDLRMFARPTFSAGNLAKVFGYFPFSANHFLLPFYLDRALGLPPATAGLFLTPLPIGMLVSSMFSGPLSDRVGTRLLAPAGLAIQALACLMLAFASPEQGLLPAIVAPLLAGFGIGTFIAPNDSAILGATPPGRLGVAAGIMGVSRTLGLLLGTSAAATLLSARLVAHADAFLPSFREVYLIITAVTLAGVYFAAVRDAKDPQRPRDPQTS